MTCGCWPVHHRTLSPVVLCLLPQGCLSRGVRASGSYQEWTRESGSFSMCYHPWSYVSNILVRPASSWGAPGRLGTPSRQSTGVDPPVAIRRGEVAQMKSYREPRCSPRERPGCRGTFGIASRVPSFHTWSVKTLQEETWDFSLDAVAGKGLILRWRGNHVVFLEPPCAYTTLISIRNDHNLEYSYLFNNYSPLLPFATVYT